MSPRTTFLSPAEWYANLPAVLASASLLITDTAGDAVLAVKPNYRDHWNIPGGILEAPSLRTCAVRARLPKNWGSNPTWVGCWSWTGWRPTPNTADRVEAALRARETRGVAYLHGGVPVG